MERIKLRLSAIAHTLSGLAQFSNRGVRRQIVGGCFRTVTALNNPHGSAVGVSESSSGFETAS
jgi:hypothetical protein